MTLVVLLAACSNFQTQKNNYLSSPETAHELLTVTSAYMTDDEVASSLDGQATTFSTDETEQFKMAFSDDVINQAMKQYVMENMPEEVAKQSIQFYRTELGSRYIASMNAVEKQYYESPDKVATQVLELRNNQKLMAQANELMQVLELDSLMESILLNGMIKPMVQGMLLKQGDQEEVTSEQIEAIAQSSLNESIKAVVHMIEGLVILSLNDFTQQEMTDINRYAASHVGQYENKVMAGAVEFALSKSSYHFGEMLAAAAGKRIVKSKFDMNACKQTSSGFFCGIRAFNAYAQHVESLYLGSAVVGKSNQYRLMMTDSGWQQLDIKNDVDDMLISKEDGSALISAEYEKNTIIDVKAYADKTLGEIAKAIEADYYKVNLNIWPFNQGGELFEICYVLEDEQEVCKLAGGGQIGSDALYLHAVFEPTDVLTDEIIRIMSTAEPLNKPSK